MELLFFETQANRLGEKIMTEENKEKLREGWYLSFDYENIEISEGAFETVENALNYIKSKSFSGSKIFLIYGERIELYIADYLNDNVERVNEYLRNEPDFEAGEDGPFYCSDEDARSLDAALKAAADKWQRERNIKASYIKFIDESTRRIPLLPAK